MTASPAFRRGNRLFTWLFILIGAISLGVGVWNLVRSLRCCYWPATDGVIQSAEMEQHAGSKGRVTFSANFTYYYQVADTHYTGTRLAFGVMSASAEYAQGYLDRYPKGKKSRRSLFTR